LSKLVCRRTFSEDEFGEYVEDFREIGNQIPELFPVLNDRIDSFAQPDALAKENRDRLLGTNVDDIGEDRFQCIVTLLRVTELAENADALMAEKTYEYLRGCLVAAHDRSMLLCALSSRALLETIGSHRWLNKKFSVLLTELRKEKEMHRALERLKAAETVFKKVTYGSNTPSEEGLDLPRALHSNDLVKELPEVVQSQYKTLCEFVHPNLGTNMSLRRISIGETFELDNVSMPTAFQACFLPMLSTILLVCPLFDQLDDLISCSFSTLGRLRNSRCSDSYVFNLPDGEYLHSIPRESEESIIRFRHCYSMMELWRAVDFYLQARELSDSTFGVTGKDDCLEASTKLGRLSFEVPKQVWERTELRPARTLVPRRIYYVLPG